MFASCRIDRWLVFLACLVACFSSHPVSAQAKLEKRSFDVSAGDAINTLKEAAQQAEVEFIFVADLVKGVRTRSIKGDYTPAGAFNHMLAGSCLQATQHGETGVYTVTAISDVQASDMERKQKSNEKTEMSSHKNRRLLRSLTAFLTLGISGLPVQANAQGKDDEIIELSPFVINEEKDSGYQATTTMAGTRIRSNLRDLGASIAVITKEFMEDMGATDGESLLSYVGNVEVGGVLGNFSDVNTSDQNTRGSRLDPQSSQRVRGLVSAELTRDFFSTNIPFDSYNTSRVEVNRGPNSILFGVGSPGGVINNATSRAQIGPDSGEFSIRIDHDGGHRESGNYNKTLIQDRLAIRIAALNENIKFQQKPAFEDDNRVFVAWNAVLLKNKKSRVLGRTSFRGSFENGKITRNAPDVVPPTDGFSGWFEGLGGQEVLNGILRVPGITLSNINNGAVAREWVLGAINAGLVQVPAGRTPEQYAQAEGQFIPMAVYNRFTTAGVNATVGKAAGSVFPIINYNSSASGTKAGYTDPVLAGIQGILIRWSPPGFPRQDVRWTDSPLAGIPGFSPQSLNNREIFDYHNYSFSGPSYLAKTDFRLQQFFLEQELLGGKAGIEIGYDKQIRDRWSFVPFDDGPDKLISIDITSDLPTADSNYDGIPDRTPNENLGRPVIRWDNTTTTVEHREQETFRATIFGTFDARDRFNGFWGRVLGSHTVTGLFESRTNDFWNRATRGVWWADSGKNPGHPHILNGELNSTGARVVTAQYYLGPDTRRSSSSSDVRLDGYVAAPYPQIGDIYGIWYYDLGLLTDVKNNWRISESLQNANVTKSRLQSKAFSLQSRILSDHIVGTYAWRQDEQRSWQRLRENGPSGPTGSLGLRIDNPGVNETDGNFNEALLFLEDEPAAVNKDDTTTWSIVGYYPEKWLGELPRDMDLSAHYYKAESFRPAGISNNILNQPLDDLTGTTKEYGFTLSMLQNRLSLRANWFETVNANARTNLGGQLGQIIGRLEFVLESQTAAERQGIPLFPSDADRLLTTTTSPSNASRLTGTDADLIGASTWDEYYQKFINILPPNVQEVYGLRIVRDANGTPSVYRNPVTGLNSTFDYLAKGMEIDIVGKVTRNWSISLNVAQQKTYTSNTGPVAVALAHEIMQRIEEQGMFRIREAPHQLASSLFGNGYLSRMRTIFAEKAKDGTRSQEQREWRVNLASRYDFKQGTLKGFSFGGALRYQSAIAAGYPNIYDEFGSVIPDVANPFMGPDEINGDVFIRYRRKLTKKVDWSVQVNTKNLYRSNGSDDIPVTINPDGRVAIIRVPNEQQYYITNTFSF